MMKTDVEVLYKYERKVYGTNFFKNSCSLEERTNTNPLPHTTDGFEFDSLSSDKEEDFESNFGNPFCSVSMRKRTLVVEKTEDKVSIKIFITNRLHSYYDNSNCYGNYHHHHHHYHSS